MTLGPLKVSNRRSSGASPRFLVLGAALASLALVVGAPGAGAAESATVLASIDGRSISTATERKPIRLRPGRLATLDLQVTNLGLAPAEVRSVRLEGRVMGLTFFAYDTSVRLSVAPGATDDLRYTLDLVGLKGQATGLIPASVVLLDGERHELATRPFVVDVRGSLWSVYGAFGLVALGLTVMGTTGFLVGLARHKLPDNRWQRAIRLLAPGAGLGLVIVFLLSALRLLVPQAGRWVPIMLISAGLFFVLGYLSPSPDDDNDTEDDEDGGGAVAGGGPLAPEPSVANPATRQG